MVCIIHGRRLLALDIEDSWTITFWVCLGPYQHVATLSKLCSPVGVGTTSFILHITHNYCVLICLHPTYHTYPEGKWHDFRISTWQTNSFGSNLFLQVSHAALLCIFWGKAAKQLIVSSIFWRGKHRQTGISRASQRWKTMSRDVRSWGATGLNQSGSLRWGSLTGQMQNNHEWHCPVPTRLTLHHPPIAIDRIRNFMWPFLMPSKCPNASDARKGAGMQHPSLPNRVVMPCLFRWVWNGPWPAIQSWREIPDRHSQIGLALTSSPFRYMMKCDIRLV